MIKNEQEQVELLPCPLCGARAFVAHGNAPEVNGYPVWCVTDRCLRLPPRSTEAEAVERWNSRLQARPDASDVERDIRIAIWNGARWQGSTDEVAQSLIRKVMDEPTMRRALAALNPSPVQEEERG